MREARYAGTKTRLWIKAKAVRGGFYTRSPIARGCAFHPCTIDDLRGRFLVRAKSQFCNIEWRDLSRTHKWRL